MIGPWLLLDCHYLAWRSYHTTGVLSYGDIQTGVLFGFFKQLITLKLQFTTDKVAFCFEAGESKRKLLFPGYKHHRHSKPMTEEEAMLIGAFHHQIRLLREEYLPRIGFVNVFAERGYESDDIIASITKTLPCEEEAVIISSDRDFFQLLRGNVSMYDPKQRKMNTLQSFRQETGLVPPQWAKVLAIAGCKTDEVPGIPRIGKKTAIKYLTDRLKPNSSAFSLIKQGWDGVVLRNKPLVLLPFAKTPKYVLAPDHISEQGWGEVCAELGLRTLRNSIPLLSGLRSPHEPIPKYRPQLVPRA